MKLGSFEGETPLLLGPMAGVTDWAFRTICAELGADITVTEMVSSRALVYRDRKSAALLRKNSGSFCGAQIFGNDPAIMAEGAALALEQLGFKRDAIDKVLKTLLAELPKSEHTTDKLLRQGIIKLNFG